jgi:Tol biopolymer transport system component
MTKTARAARRSTILVGVGIAALAIVLVAPAALGANAKTKRVSIPTGGGIPNNESSAPSISADGRFVAFSSKATSLIANDGNSDWDIFVHDRKKKKTRRVSIPTGGGIPNSASFDPSISADGRYVAFQSFASNLISNDGNAAADIFVHDRKNKKTRRVSIPTGGGIPNSRSDAPSISANGRFVAFQSSASNLVANDGNAHEDIFVHDRKKKKTRRVSIPSRGGIPNSDSNLASISGDGRYVAFFSLASNLIANDGNSFADIFVHDRKKKTTKRVSIRNGGGNPNNESTGPSISADGRFVAFVSFASNLIANDGNIFLDAFVHDRAKKKTRRVSIPTGGGIPNNHSFVSSISANGRFVAFQSRASNLIANDGNTVRDVFVRGPLR